MVRKIDYYIDFTDIL